MHRRIAVPADEERQLAIDQEILHADLLPLQQHPIGSIPVAFDRGPTDPRLDRTKIIGGDDPAQPAAPGLGTGPHSLAERGLVGRWMIEDGDNLDVVSVGQREDLIAGAEARMETTVGESGSQLFPESLRGCIQALRPGRVGQVIQMHASLLPGGPQTGSAGWRSRPPRRDSNSSHRPISSAYAGWPIRAISSSRFSR